MNATNETVHCPFCDADITDDEEVRCTGSLNVSCPNCGRLISHDDTADNAIVYRAEGKIPSPPANSKSR